MRRRRGVLVGSTGLCCSVWCTLGHQRTSSRLTGRELLSAVAMLLMAFSMWVVDAQVYIIQHHERQRPMRCMM